ncbi:hypothetical protein M0D44_01540 [Xanthomonas prunicola]|uniref:hypothetical protein n=1 Tax=Xanthomonas prunicola TaxID=2053930 RepID=UPI0021B22B02|nr:hypothetical protein [Xanthomonas prunicola]UXA49295.1 hypothetical protein M0D44_01540 [Xanthomonas prunicola]
MTNISESSVVVAIRDWQWTQTIKRKPPDGSVPMPVRYVGLSKYAEYKLGDYITEQDDRLLLIEVKATRDKINEEWSKPTKNSFNMICDWLRNSSPTSSDKTNIDNLRRIRQSAQCHHVVFYEAEPVGTQPPDANLMLMPYLLAVKSRCRTIPWKLMARKRAINFELGTVALSQHGDPIGSIRYRARESVWLDSLPGLRTRIIDSTSGAAHWDYLGLPLDDFQEYVNAVCVNSQPLSAIVMSQSGGFSAYFESTDELRSFVGPPLAPKPQVSAPYLSGIPLQPTSDPEPEPAPAMALATPPQAPALISSFSTKP